MADDLKRLLNETEKEMQKSIDSMEVDFQTYRTGRASPHLVEKVMVDYHGTGVPLLQLATITVPEPQVIIIRPFDPGTFKLIEKAIQASDINLTPINDSKVIRLNIPPLTQERRKELAKAVGKRVEEAKVSVRNHRHDTLMKFEKMDKPEKSDRGKKPQEKKAGTDKSVGEDDIKRAKQELDSLTHRYTTRADELGGRKEKEILEM